MKYPIVLKLAYIGDGLLPVQTVDSTHYLESIDDMSVLVGYVNVFSEYDWTSEEFGAAIQLSAHSFRTATEYDSNLHLYVI